MVIEIYDRIWKCWREACRNRWVSMNMSLGILRLIDIDIGNAPLGIPRLLYLDGGKCTRIYLCVCLKGICDPFDINHS